MSQVGVGAKAQPSGKPHKTRTPQTLSLNNVAHNSSKLAASAWNLAAKLVEMFLRFSLKRSVGFNKTRFCHAVPLGTAVRTGGWRVSLGIICRHGPALSWMLLVMAQGADIGEMPSFDPRSSSEAKKRSAGSCFDASKSPVFVFLTSVHSCQLQCFSPQHF